MRSGSDGLLTGALVDEVIAVLPQDGREASILSIAVNGVMAGCRPEYMPFLIAAIEALAEPRFHLHDTGSTPGWEPVVIVSGPIAKELEFNSGQWMMRVGRQANTSVQSVVSITSPMYSGSGRREAESGTRLPEQPHPGAADEQARAVAQALGGLRAAAGRAATLRCGGARDVSPCVAKRVCDTDRMSTIATQRRRSAATPQGKPSGIPLGKVAYDAVLDAISNQKLQPGERISEYSIAKWLDMSRTPAREALRRLEDEGLLVSHPARGLTVASVDSDAIFELYAAREILESAAAALAAQRATDAEIATLQHMVELEAGMVENPAEMYAHNRAFHNVVYKAAHNRYLLKFLHALADILSAQRSPSTLVKEERRRAVITEHRALVEAIAARDAKAAQEISQRHVKAALQASTRLHLQNVADAAVRAGKPRAAGVPSR